jgi:hypothetical protein
VSRDIHSRECRSRDCRSRDGRSRDGRCICICNSCEYVVYIKLNVFAVQVQYRSLKQKTLG